MIYDEELKMLIAESEEEKTIYGALENSRIAVERMKLGFELEQKTLEHLETKWAALLTPPEE